MTEIIIPSEIDFIDIVGGPHDAIDDNRSLGHHIANIKREPGRTYQIKWADEWKIRTRVYPSTSDGKINIYWQVNEWVIFDIPLNENMVPVFIEMAKAHCKENGIQLTVNGDAAINAGLKK